LICMSISLNNPLFALAAHQPGTRLFVQCSSQRPTNF
jgi:hypothetical protein